MNTSIHVDCNRYPLISVQLKEDNSMSDKSYRLPYLPIYLIKDDSVSNKNNIMASIKNMYSVSMCDMVLSKKHIINESRSVTS